jgi:heterodisulfide reductase subunit A-like polyferredoxin
MLDRFYAICNCCDCCCGAMQAHRNGTPMLVNSGYVARADSAYCSGCGACAVSCPFCAITVANGTATVDESLCMGCGICVSVCGFAALVLARDASKAPPLEIKALVERAFSFD